jgi:hypothetical protein
MKKMVAWLINNKEWLFSGIGITVVGGIGFVVKKIWTARKNAKFYAIVSNEDHFKKHFPRLSKPVLENYIKRIAEIYKDLSVETITLYRYHSKYFSSVNAKYVVVIEVDKNTKSDSRLSQRFYDLQYATGWMATIPDPGSSKDLGIDNGFSDVYIDKPDKDYLNEWAFYAKYTDDPMPLGIMIDEGKSPLFKTKGKGQWQEVGSAVDC